MQAAGADCARDCKVSYSWRPRSAPAQQAMDEDHTSVAKKTPRYRGVSGLQYQTGAQISGSWPVDT